MAASASAPPIRVDIKLLPHHGQSSPFADGSDFTTRRCCRRPAPARTPGQTAGDASPEPRCQRPEDP
ncbi:hypothetical protein KCP69_12895 [Salmonella enterica subsp. enterica]|nr:hypothetical protein KCP69_12895 [Salmonella enterica subsp. enterica]